MPSLTNAPRTREDISEFLGDRMDTSIPAIQGTDINDGDLINATRTVELGNGYKFEITLPSGRVLESAPVGSDYPKRDAIMQWLGAVRESIVEDAASAGRAQRDAELLEPVNSPAPRRAAASGERMDIPAAELPTEPVEYAKFQLRAAIERLAALTAAEADVAKWQRVVQSLTGESVAKRKRRKKRKVRKSIHSDSVGKLAISDPRPARLFVSSAVAGKLAVVE